MAGFVVLLGLALVVGLIGLLSGTNDLARADKFAIRHGLVLAGSDRAHLVARLRHSRNWRVAGAIAGAVASAVRGAPHGQIHVGFGWVLVGWFAGVVVAEFRADRCVTPRLPPVAQDPGSVPGPRLWLRCIPMVLVAGAVAVTVILLIAEPGACPRRRVGNGVRSPPAAR